VYVKPNFKTKKALREALEQGDTVTVFRPAPIGPDIQCGVVDVEGPWAPEHHTWYADVEVKDGRIIRIVE